MRTSFAEMPPHIKADIFAKGDLYRARVRQNPAVETLHRLFDELCGDILALESRHGVLEALLPGGDLAKHRKEWSYEGVLEDGRDFGNWGYAVIMRHLFCSGFVDHNVCKDELLGDVIEAVLHLGFGFGRTEGVCYEYARLLNDVCLVFEVIQRWFGPLEHRETSSDMALILI